jgi:hypothetical protein
LESPGVATTKACFSTFASLIVSVTFESDDNFRKGGDKLEFESTLNNTKRKRHQFNQFLNLREVGINFARLGMYLNFSIIFPVTALISTLRAKVKLQNARNPNSLKARQS